MSSPNDWFQPVNRRILIGDASTAPAQTKGGVLLPNDFEKVSDKFENVKLLATAEDCNSVFKHSHGSNIVVEKSMIEELLINGRSVNVILENYVVGIVSRGFDAN